MDEYDQIEADYMDKHPGHATPGMQMQLYPLSMVQQQQPQMYPLAQVPATPEPLLQRRLAGVPVWGWGLGLIAAGGAAFFFLNKKKKVEKNGGESDSGGDLPALPAGWQPSRSGFGDRLKVVLHKNGIADKTTIYTDADEATQKLKQVSPLVTIQCKTKAPLKELDKFAKREGLSAVEHEGGVIGFYPGGGKKGKAWEEYIDALRDDGQKV
jgi:hypothetical protein